MFGYKKLKYSLLNHFLLKKFCSKFCYYMTQSVRLQDSNNV